MAERVFDTTFFVLPKRVKTVPFAPARVKMAMWLANVRLAKSNLVSWVIGTEMKSVGDRHC